MVRDLSDPWVEIKRLTARVRALEKATPLASSSVGRGRIRLYDGGELLIQDGNLTVSGTGQITGTLNVSGTLNVTGTTNLDGPVVIDGDTDINGTLDVNGATKITGATTVTGNLQVNAPGQIKVGANMTLTPSTGGGSIQFPGGEVKASTGNGIETKSGNYSCTLVTGGASLGRVGLSFNAVGSAISIVGITTATKAGVASGALWQDPLTNQIYRAP